MVFLILAVVWAGVLASWYRTRHQRGHLDSVGKFRRHLSVIERVTPRRVRAANSRRGPRRAAPEPAALAPVLAVAAHGSRMTRPQRRSSSPRVRHQRSQRRRREVFFALFGAVVGAAALWTLLPLPSVLYSQMALDACFLTYLLLLIRARNLQAEREMKIRFLEFPSGRYASERRPVGARPAPAPNYATSLDYKVSASGVGAARPAV